MGGAGAAHPDVPPPARDRASRPAPHHRGDHLAHDNGAKWRRIPAALGPWWMAAQTFSRWSRLGAWERLLELAQRRGGGEAGMAGLTASEAVPRTLDGTSIRAHHKAAGAAKKGGPQ